MKNKSKQKAPNVSRLLPSRSALAKHGFGQRASSKTRFEITKLTKSIFKLQTFEVGCQQKDMKEMHRLMLELSKGKKYSVLRIACACFHSSDKMKTMIASKQFTDACYASAYVIKSLANRFCARFVIQFHNPVVPSRMFEDEATAMEWLKEQEAVQYGKE